MNTADAINQGKVEALILAARVARRGSLGTALEAVRHYTAQRAAALNVEGASLQGFLVDAAKVQGWGRAATILQYVDESFYAEAPKDDQDLSRWAEDQVREHHI